MFNYAPSTPFWGAFYLRSLIMVDKPTRNNGKFVKGNKEGNRFSKENQPKDLKLKRAIKREFQQVARECLEDLQDFATLKMSEWVKQKLDDLDTLTTYELEKIQKFLEFLRDSSGQKPTDKQEITNTTPQIVVANQTDMDILEKIANVKVDKDLL